MKRGATPGHRGDPTEDLGDEASQEAELLRLKRKLRVMEGDRKSYAEESRNILRKQQSEIEKLLNENEEIRIVLQLATSNKQQKIDTQDMSRLVGLIESLDSTNQEADVEQKRIEHLDDEIKEMETKMAEYRRGMGSETEEMGEKALQKQLRVMENRLDKSTVKFNQQLSVNFRLRQEIDHLRQERSIFDNLYKKLTKELNETKQNMNEIIMEASQAYEERDEAQTKMIALKERGEKDMAQHDVEMKELKRIIEHDNKLKEFMMCKAHDRAEYKDEEEAKKKKISGGDKDKDAEKQQIASYEDAFERVKEATGEDDIDVIVTNFLQKEDENFALFNYVNELNDEVEHLNEEISDMQNEINIFESEDVRHEEERKQTMRDLEVRNSRALFKEKDQADKRSTQINKELDELRSGVGAIFSTIRCDSSTIQEMLGSEDRVTNKNILQYMGIIEQKTMELIQARQYLHMKKNPPKPEKKEKKGEPTPPPLQQSQKIDLPSPICIVPPNTTGSVTRLYIFSIIRSSDFRRKT
ncbi:hypothetical protein FSP39_020235 [Pinctada imbricata]|uniref:ODAD1 central coiled coil region domain-containing protein n=1 Tax=Pinctada imbricata TaxID=66713 RepID=A0AA88XGB4_PINIB|nr:hypothetical protein FSP39_020235 [Pinctada imbricata]